MRRTRQISTPDFTASCELDPIQIQISGADAAIATYTYRFHSTRTGNAGGRATQVFQRNERGQLRIIHEHMSSAEPVSPQELPAA